VLVAFSGQAFSTTFAVGTCTSFENFATIQQAVNGVPAGSVIKICPGTYREQVLITGAINLQGITYAGADAVVIAPPAGGLVQNATGVGTEAGNPIAAQILAQNTAGPVLISNLTVDGTGNGLACGPDVRGILFQSASGTVNHVAVRNQIPNDVPNGCQVGQGIYVETDTGLTSAVIIEGSSVHNYNKNGIVARYAGTTVTINGNYVQGSGVVPSGGAAQNGIELAFGAAGKISNNTVIDNFYGDITLASSSDILLYDAAENAAITVSTNTVGNSQIPIALITDTAGLGDGVTVSSNKIFGTSTDDAIDACTNGNTITKNTVFNSAQSGVHFDASCGGTGNNNIAQQNTILESACAGILADPSTSGNVTSAPTNIFWAVPFQITGSTSKCTIPSGPAHAKTAHKFSPGK
jgi:parallel beta-helix repeat protein